MRMSCCFLTGINIMTLAKTFDSLRTVLTENGFKIEICGFQKTVFLNDSVIHSATTGSPFFIQNLSKNAYIIDACHRSGLRLERELLQSYLQILQSEFIHVIPTPPPQEKTPLQIAFAKSKIQELKTMLAGVNHV